MEDVLEVYQRPYDPLFPQVCIDEMPVQLLSDVRDPLPCAPGRPARVDNEYERKGTANVFVGFEPLAGWRRYEVTERRTAVDFARFVKGLLDERYQEAKKVVLVMDNLNTHSPASLYEAFGPEQARRLTERLEIHYTPKHGSWLNMAEIEFSALGRRLDDRTPDRDALIRRAAAVEQDRNANAKGADWRFTTADARIKLKRLYPLLD
jgi:transposase